MKSYIFKTLVFILPLIFLIGAINVWVDPGEIFSNRNSEVAKEMLKGNNVIKPAMPSNWIELHKAFLEERKKKNLPKLSFAFLGSSRSSLITKDLIERNNFHNFCLPGCNIMDLVAFSNLLEQYQSLPDTLIMNLDPWMFYPRKQVLKEGDGFYILDSTKKLQCQIPLRTNFLNSIKNFGLSDTLFPLREMVEHDFKNKATALFSPSYFQSSIKNLRILKTATTTLDYIPGHFVLRHDGTYCVSKWSKKQVEKVNISSLTHAQLAGNHFFYEGCIPTPYFNLLSQLTSYLKQKGVTLFYFMSPVHPNLYPAQTGNHFTVMEAEIRKVASLSNVGIIGSFNPYKFSTLAENRYFTDSYHVSSEGIKIILTYELNRLGL